MEIKQLNPNDPDDFFIEITKMFRDMHLSMEEHGLSIKLEEGGEVLWINSIRKTLNKINIVYYGIENNELIGFSAGNLRILPSYLGNKKIGFISHLFIKQDFRKKSIGEKLIKAQEDWFNSQACEEVELEVLFNNKISLSFVSKIGYKPLLLKLKKA